MKKIFEIILTFCLMVFVIMIMIGCSSGNNSVGDATSGDSNSNNQTEATQKSSELPTFAELIALNSYENILKEHSTLFVKNTCTATNAEESYVEDAIFFQGDGKIDYHMKHTNTASGSIVEDLSRVGNQWYYYNPTKLKFFILEYDI